MKLAVVADEIGTSLQEQIESMKQGKIHNIEIRKIDDKYLWEFSKEELLNFKKILDDNKINVVTLDSPVGKKPFPYERKMELFNMYIEISKIFKNKYLRIFSNIAENPNDRISSKDLERLCTIAQENNIELLMENERKTYAETPYDCYKIIENQNNINIIYDLSNSFLEGHDVFEWYEKSKERITYIHLRDYNLKEDKYAYLGEGDIGIAKFMKIIKEDGFDGIISIETHLPMNNSGKTKRELFLKSMDNFYAIVKELDISIN